MQFRKWVTSAKHQQRKRPKSILRHKNEDILRVKFRSKTLWYRMQRTMKFWKELNLSEFTKPNLKKVQRIVFVSGDSEYIKYVDHESYKILNFVSLS